MPHVCVRSTPLAATLAAYWTSDADARVHKAVESCAEFSVHWPIAPAKYSPIAAMPPAIRKALLAQALLSPFWHSLLTCINSFVSLARVLPMFLTLTKQKAGECEMLANPSPAV